MDSANTPAERPERIEITRDGSVLHRGEIYLVTEWIGDHPIVWHTQSCEYVHASEWKSADPPASGEPDEPPAEPPAEPIEFEWEDDGELRTDHGWRVQVGELCGYITPMGQVRVSYESSPGWHAWDLWTCYVWRGTMDGSHVDTLYQSVRVRGMILGERQARALCESMIRAVIAAERRGYAACQSEIRSTVEVERLKKEAAKAAARKERVTDLQDKLYCAMNFIDDINGVKMHEGTGTCEGTFKEDVKEARKRFKEIVFRQPGTASEESLWERLKADHVVRKQRARLAAEIEEKQAQLLALDGRRAEEHAEGGE
jgi:hypothetical protein